MEMLKLVIAAVVEAIAEAFPKEELKKAIDKGLDKIEAQVKASANTWDDAIVLPLISKLIREPFDIPQDSENVQVPEIKAE